MLRMLPFNPIRSVFAKIRFNFVFNFEIQAVVNEFLAVKRIVLGYVYSIGF